MPQDLQQFLDKDFYYFFGLAAVWCICGFGFTYFRMKKKGVTFPDKSTVNIKFEEAMASGHSHKSIFTKLGSARNCLKVMVTDKELWITAQFPFNLIAYYYDGIHKIPLTSIRKVSQSGRSILIEFERNDRTACKFELHLKKPDNFLKLLQNNS